MGLSSVRTNQCVSGTYIAFQRKPCVSISREKFSLEIFLFLSKLSLLEITSRLSPGKKDVGLIGGRGLFTVV